MNYASKEVFEQKEIQKETEEVENGAQNGPKFISKYICCVAFPVEKLETVKRAISHYLNEYQKITLNFSTEPTTNLNQVTGFMLLWKIQSLSETNLK